MMSHLVKGLKYALRVSLVCIIGSFVMLAALMLVWRLRAGHIFSVQTDSMVPILRPGDAVIVAAVKPSQLLPGDIITYRSRRSPRLTVTHRLVAVEPTTQNLLLKGDRLTTPDPLVASKMVVGRVSWFIPKAGYLLDFTQRPLLLLPGVYVGCVLMVGLEMRYFLYRKYHHYRLAERRD